MFATRRRGGGDLGMKKGWSSELGPPPARVSRIVLPFDKGRAVPTKWEDAEKWIVSPVGSENNAVGRSVVVEPAHHRQPKSKSGPLVRQAYLSSQTMGSPLSFDGGRFAGFDTSPPFLNGVLKGGGDGGAGRGRFSMEKYEPCILRSVSVRRWRDSMGETCSSSIPSSSQVSDEPTKGIREASTKLSSSVLRKDMATQMSTDESTQSSPKESHSFSQSTTSHPLEEMESQLSDLKTREGQVDDRVIVTSWSKKHVRKSSGKHSVNIFEWKKKTTEAKADMSAGLEAGTPPNCISKCMREEAKIAAWENLQKAKAEAAIRKLEMKLEKKRSSSMDKILGKLQSAQRKTQDMRRTNQQQQVENCSKRSSHFRRTGQISSFSSCFTCPTF